MLKILENNEEGDKNKKTLALKDAEEKYCECDEEITLFVQNLRRFMKHEKQQKEKQRKILVYSFMLLMWKNLINLVTRFSLGIARNNQV